MFRLYGEALQGFRRASATCVALFACSGLFESLGIAALLPFMQSSIGEESNKKFLGLEGDNLAGAALSVLLVLGVLSAVMRYVATTRLYRIQADVEASLRARMTTALFGMRWTTFHKMSFGEAAKSVLSEGEAIGRGVNGLVNGIGSALIALVFAATAIVVSVELTAVTVGFAVVVLLVYRTAGRRARAKGRDLSEQSAIVTELANDLFNNYKFYRSTGVRERALERAATVYRAWADGFARTMRFQPSTRLTFDVGGLVFITGVLGIGVLVARTGAAEAFVFLALFYRLAPKLQQAQSGLLIAHTQSAWWETWKERYEGALAARDVDTGSRVLEANPSIEFAHVSFAFGADQVSVLDDVSWRLPAGECLAVVGESGSGKTTTLDLVTGLLRP
ncbi:MAG: ATP-binding cassette domain-containing protein, partial [Myxococcota bacterium]